MFRFFNKAFLKESAVIMFHAIYNDRKYNQLKSKTSLGTSLSDFQKIIKWFSKHYKFITLDQYLVGDTGILITFDDGYANNLTEALPILEKYSVPALIFIATSHIKQFQDHSRMTAATYPIIYDDEIDSFNHYFDALTVTQLIKLSKSNLIEIGNHTVNHPNLQSTVNSQLEMEIKDSNLFLKRITKRNIKAFSFPYGSFCNNSVEILQELKYKCAFLLENGEYCCNKYKIKRLGIYNSNPIYLYLKLSKFYDVFSYIKKQR